MHPSAAKDLACGPGQFTGQLRDSFAHQSNGNINGNDLRHVERVIILVLRTLLGPILVVAQ